MAEDYRVIGTPVVRPDGAEMISGQAVYGPDVTQPGCCGARSCAARCRTPGIRSMDLEKARALPGVTVIAAGDVPDRRYGYAIEDEQIFAVEKVRYAGEPVAAAAAPDEERALEALSLIDVEYEELPAVLSAAEGARDGAPLVHQELGPARSVYLASWNPGARHQHHPPCLPPSGRRGRGAGAGGLRVRGHLPRQPDPSRLHGAPRLAGLGAGQRG